VDRPPLEILFEDNHCIAISKPPGLLATHYQGLEETLDRDVKRYLKKKHNKPGNVYLGIVHRLDRVVSGVLLFARTSKAARRIAQQFREGTVEKIYWAVTEGGLCKAEGTLLHWLLKNHRLRKVEVVEPNTTHARPAALRYRLLGQARKLTWLELRPETGRTHQLRVQLAQNGCPIYGDAKYGSARSFGRAIALHARSLSFVHPTRDESITLTADVPAAWKDRFRSFFGTRHERADA